MKISKNGMEYSYFTMLFPKGGEFNFFYKDKEYWVSQRRDLNEFYFTIVGYNTFVFNNPEALIKCHLIDGKTLYDIWEDLEIVE
jgi:hypothetical protein